MATGSYLPIRPHSPNIYTRGTLSIKEKASGTWKVGAPLVLNGGYVEEAGTGPATVKYIAAEAGHNGSADGTYSCIVWPVTDSDLWEATLDNATAQSDIGNNVGLVKDATTGYWYADQDDTGDQVSVVDFVLTPDLGAVGDAKSRVIVKFDSGNIAGN